jgi:hypothetical protein
MTAKVQERYVGSIRCLRDYGRALYGSNWVLHDYKCFFCGGRADTIEHLRPRGRRGPNKLENIRPAC